jgi:cupin 2 domain-containing protein
MTTVENIFSIYELPDSSKDELFTTLVNAGNVRIERIVSCGQKSPEGFWYDQHENEWVILLKGHAIIEFEQSGIIELHEGDHLNIPAHQKHRVTSTSSNPECVWLTVFYN